MALEILKGNYKPPEVDMALPARDYQEVAAAMVLNSGFLLLADELGLGKAQPLDARVLTPGGWVEMGDLRVGDAVVDPDGGRAEVLGVYPQGEREVFRVTTSDGAMTECCGEHLWLVQTKNDRNRGTDRVKSLNEIVEYGLRKKYQGRDTWSMRQWFLPLTKPVVYGERENLPLDPYLLGVLLGDGCFKKNSVGLSNEDHDVVSRVKRSLPAGVMAMEAGGVDWRLSSVIPGVKNGVLDVVRSLGLDGKRSWEKWIPDVYLKARWEDRLELLRGLMDADAECTNGGVCMLTTTSPQLVDGVLELVRGLGGIVTVGEPRRRKYTYKGEARMGRQSWGINVRLGMNPFFCERKASRWHAPCLARSIDGVESVGKKEVQCIRVSSKRSLYVTDGYVVTHNTVSAIRVLADKRALPALVVCLAHLPPHWVNQLQKFLPDLKVHVMSKGTAYEIGEADVIIGSYHKMRGWHEYLAGKMKGVVYDECQELRRRESQKYRACRSISSGADYVMGLSATPIYNYGEEFWSVIDAMKPGALGSLEEFSREWTDMGFRKVSIRDPSAFGTYLREVGLMLRREREDVGRELPQLSHIIHEVGCDMNHLNEVEDAATELAKTILTQRDGFTVMRASQELSNTLRQATGIAKARYVAEFVKMLIEDQGRPVVLFGWHREVYRLWGLYLREYEPAWYTGSESVSKKNKEAQRFINGETKLLIMSLRSGAGLDGLQEVCSTPVIGELDWSPGVLEQNVGRVHRDGQEHPVFAYYPVANDGSDPIMMDVIGIKRGQVEGVRDPTGNLVTRLSIDPDHVKKLAAAYLRSRG